jgi:lipoprotein-releasing system permease protein
VAAAVLAVQLVIGAGRMLAAIGRWQLPAPREAAAKGAEEPPAAEAGAEWWLLHGLLGALTLGAAAVGIPMLVTGVPMLHVPVRLFGTAAVSLALLLAPALGFWRRWREAWPATLRVSVSLLRTLAGAALGAVLLWAIIHQVVLAGEEAATRTDAVPPLLDPLAVGDIALEPLEWAGRHIACLLAVGAVAWGLVYLFVVRGILSRPPAARVRQFMADRLFRKKRIAVFSVLAVMLAVAMELIGVGVTNGMLEAVKDASRRVLADVVIEGPMEGIAYYDEFIDEVRDVTVEVDGKPVKAITAATPTVAGFAVAKFYLGRLKRTYSVQVIGVRMDPDEPTETQYDGVTRFAEGLMVETYGPGVRPRLKVSGEAPADAGQPPIRLCIPGKDVLPIPKGSEILSRLQGAKAVLTTIPVSELDQMNLTSVSFVIADFHQSGVYEFDNSHFYVDFDEAQELFAMTALRDVAGELVRPATCNRILFRIDPAADVEAAQRAIQARWKAFLDDPRYQWPANDAAAVETWMARQKDIIRAYEQQKVLFILIFAVISIVAGFLIMAIFIMIVSEKTRDIGILKSLGASDGDVLRTFLSFALVIGVVGSALGLGIASAFLHYINPIKDWAGDLLGTKIFGGDVWIFQDLPTRLEPADMLMILVGSVAISVLAAYIPARRAAKLPPVKALSYE